MKIKEDLERLNQIMKALGLSRQDEDLMLELILALRSILGSYRSMIEHEHGLTLDQSAAICIGALTTSTMALSMCREEILNGRDPKAVFDELMEFKDGIDGEG